MRLAIVVALAGAAAGSTVTSQQPSDASIRVSYAAAADPSPLAPPVLFNRDGVPVLMRHYYPASLRRAHIGGEIVVSFTVDTLGKVEPGSLDIVSGQEDGLIEATRSVVARLRFKPGRLSEPDSRAIAVRATIAFVWDAGK